jgi:hypothetical protein
MTTIQKIIKYGAIAFGIFLCINIITAIVMGIGILFGITTGFSVFSENVSTERIDFSEVYENVQELRINVELSKLNIKKGNEFKVEARNITKDFESNLQNGNLVIREKSNFNKWFHLGFFNPNSEVTIYIPEEAHLSDMQKRLI